MKKCNNKECVLKNRDSNCDKAMVGTYMRHFAAAALLAARDGKRDVMRTQSCAVPACRWFEPEAYSIAASPFKFYLFEIR